MKPGIYKDGNTLVLVQRHNEKYGNPTLTWFRWSWTHNYWSNDVILQYALNRQWQPVNKLEFLLLTGVEVKDSWL